MSSIRQCLLNRWAAVALAALLLAGPGCAYFNTFYHARKYYREAEAKRREAEEMGRSPSAANSLYEKAVKKCAKIIVEYPGSKWVDDALLLMGNGFYYQGEFTRALKKYDELITYYPESPFVPEARWMRGLANYRLDRLEDARVIFLHIAETDKDPEQRAEARVMLARSWQSVGQPKRCIEEIEALLDAGEDLPVGPKAYLVLGDCQRASGDLASAVSTYEESAARSRRRAERFEAQLRVAEGLQELGRLDEAGAFYEDLLDEEVNLARLARLRLAMGRLMVERGDVEGGIEILERVANDTQVSDLPAEAQFEIGRTYERAVGDFEGAIGAYDAVGSKRPDKDLAKKAKTRKASVTRMRDLLAIRGRARPDSLPILDFKIAEHCFFSMDRTDWALEYYRAVIDEGSQEDLAAKSLLAVAWIREHVKGDSTGSAVQYERLVERYPETDYADRAREVLGLPPRPRPEPADTVAAEPEAIAEGAPADSLGGEVPPLIPDDPATFARPDSATGDTTGVGISEDALREKISGGPGFDRSPISGILDSLSTRRGRRTESADSARAESAAVPPDTLPSHSDTVPAPNGNVPKPEDRLVQPDEETRAVAPADSA